MKFEYLSKIIHCDQNTTYKKFISRDTGCIHKEEKEGIINCCNRLLAIIIQTHCEACNPQRSLKAWTFPRMQLKVANVINNY